MTPYRFTLVRDVFTDRSTTGQLYDDDGTWICYTLEDRSRFPGEPKVRTKTAIPAGSFRVVITTSPRFRRDLPELLDVPEFSGIRIHPGNDPDDTEGCILPGLSRRADFVGSSRLAFGKVEDTIWRARAAGRPVFVDIVEATRGEVVFRSTGEAHAFDAQDSRRRHG